MYFQVQIMRKRKKIIIGLVALLIFSNSMLMTEAYAATTKKVTTQKSVTTNKKKMKVKSKTLAIRKGASTKQKVLVNVKKGQVVNYISTSKDKKWVKVEYKGKTGYAYSKDLEWVKETSTTSQVKTQVTVLSSTLTIRKGASSKQKSIATVKKGTKLTAIGTIGSSWVKVEYKGKVGYVLNKNSKCLKKVTATSSEDKAVNQVIQAINAISSTVTLNQKEQITKARVAYNKLSSSAKKKVTNRTKLEKAEKEIASLEAINTKAKQLSDKISKLNKKVTLSDRTYIESVRKEYDKSEAKVKKLVSNIGILEDAERKLKVLVSEQGLVNAVVSRINGLDRTITLEDATVIESVRSDYEELSSSLKALVYNENILESAENQLKDAIQHQEMADVVIQKISVIKEEIKLEDSELIENIREDYEKLPVASKTLVYNHNVLEEAELKLSNLKKEYAEAEKAVESYLKELDKLSEAEQVKLSDKESIVSVRNQYEQLNALAKDMISQERNQKLVELEGVLKVLEKEEQDKAAALYVEGLIKKLDKTILYEDYSLIKEARSQYNRLNDYAKSLVRNLAILEHAEVVHAEVRARIANVFNLINNIPEQLTLEDKPFVVAAREAYEQLSLDEKSAIVNTQLSILIYSEEKIDRLETTLKYEELSEFSNQVKALLSKEEITIEDKESVIALKEQYYLIDESIRYAVGEEFYDLCQLEAQIKLLESQV